MKITAGEAVEKLKSGDVVAIPTETVYGLAAIISSPDALKKIFQTKQRPFFDPLIVHTDSIESGRRLAAEWPDPIALLAQKFWPGPLTVVVPKADHIDSLITSGLDSVGLRCPSHPLALEILARLGQPVAAPSANMFGRTSPTSAQHVEDEFFGQVSVVDGGDCEVGIESTVIRFNKEKDIIEILRPGAIHEQQLVQALAGKFPRIRVHAVRSEVAPGHLDHHYQPSLPLIILDTLNRQLISNWLKNKLNCSLDDCAELQLPDEAALASRTLYAELRRLSSGTSKAILYEFNSTWKSANWAGLRDRITKAASFTLVRDDL